MRRIKLSQKSFIRWCQKRNLTPRQEAMNLYGIFDGTRGRLTYVYSTQLTEQTQIFCEVAKGNRSRFCADLGKQPRVLMEG